MVGFYSGEPIDSAAEQAQGTNLVPSTTGQVLGADIQQGVADTPVAKLYGLASRYDNANAQDAAPLSAADANAKYGIPGQLSFDKPTFDAVASSLSQDKHADLARQDILARGPSGLATTVAGFGARMLPQIFDPINVAASFVPGLGEARAASLLGRVGVDSALATRAVAGATQGAIGQALLEPLQAGIASQDHEDWSMGSALSDVAFGGLLGGGLHTMLGGGHAAPDEGEAVPSEPAPTLPQQPPTPDQMANPITAQMEAAGPLGRDAALREGIAGLVEDRPNNVSEGLTLADIPAPPTAAAPESLVSFLTRKGGVRDDAGELRAMDAGKARVGFLRKQGGMALDDARSEAEEAGYIKPGSDINDLLDAVNGELRGQKVFADTGQNEAYRQQQQAEMDARRDTMDHASAYSAVQEIDDQLDNPLSGDDMDHAALLVRQGMTPEEAVYEASRSSTMDALGLEADPAERVKEDAFATVRSRATNDTPEVASARRQADNVAKEAPPVAAIDPDGKLAEAQAAYDKVRGSLDASGDEGMQADMAKLDEGDAESEGNAKAYEAIGACAAARI